MVDVKPSGLVSPQNIPGLDRVDLDHVAYRRFNGLTRFRTLRPDDLPAPAAFFIGVCEPVRCTRILLSLYGDFDLRPLPEQNNIVVHANIYRRIEFPHRVLEDA